MFSEALILCIRYRSLIYIRSLMNCYIFLYRVDYLLIYDFTRLDPPYFQLLSCTSSRNSRYTFLFLGSARYCLRLYSFRVLPNSRSVFRILFLVNCP